MIDFVDINTMRRLVALRGVSKFISELSAEIEQDYHRWDLFAKSPRHAVHSDVGVIELMPTSDGTQYGFKYVNGHPKNPDAGLLTVMAFGVLADVRTGYPLLLSEMTILTALRTAATSVMAARHLARRDSKVMALIGNGSQSEFQAIGFHHDTGITQVRLYDVDPAATDKLIRNLTALHLPGLDVVRCKSTEDACRGADIITTITADKKNATILTPEMVLPGMHLNAVGGDCPGKTELQAQILTHPASKVFVEYEPQSRIEGEIQQMPETFKVTEFADLLSGKAAGRTTREDITIFDSVGFALEDFSALRYVHRLYKEIFGTKETLDLVPDTDDPKNLFGLLTQAPAKNSASSWLG